MVLFFSNFISFVEDFSLLSPKIFKKSRFFLKLIFPNVLFMHSRLNQLRTRFKGFNIMEGDILLLLNYFSSHNSFYRIFWCAWTTTILIFFIFCSFCSLFKNLNLFIKFSFLFLREVSFISLNSLDISIIMIFWFLQIFRVYLLTSIRLFNNHVISILLFP